MTEVRPGVETDLVTLMNDRAKERGPERCEIVYVVPRDFSREDFGCT